MRKLKREKTKKIYVGNIIIGGSNNLIIQTMCKNKTSNYLKVIDEILEYEKLGCEIIRVSILDKFDAESIKKIKEKINIPIVADIHFDYNLAILSIINGADKIRLNPGNIKKKENLLKIIEVAKKYNTPIRIGINTGSICYRSVKDIVNTMLRYIKIFENEKFYNLVLSIKSSDLNILYKSNIMLSKKTKYPLHIGLTESGDYIGGIVKSSIVVNDLLKKGIGATIRISLPGKRENEINVCKKLLSINNIRKFPDIIACPSCGRNTHDMSKILNFVKEYLGKEKIDIKIAVMGCIVNGIGESGKSDIGIFPSDDKIVIYKNNKYLKSVSDDDSAILEVKKLIYNFKGEKNK